MDSQSIRERFVDFFREREHAEVPSSSLIASDPSLLLTNAGMNQFKPYFLGEQTAPYQRAVSVQKCCRTPDIDEVGKTARHLTFFEMMGNFSFGDYYKEKACPWAWELVTEGYGIDPDRLWVTVYETDDEARQIWIDSVGVRPERIIDGGKKENFWAMGVAGPCGPDSEIFFDLGERFGEASELGPLGNEDRYLEIWNLVFMQNECNSAIEPVAELPKKNIDTGAGVERFALVLQGVDTIYETDMLGGLVKLAEQLVGRKYNSEPKVDKALRVIADHGRFLTFLIADGVLPSNEARGYVLRRVMRRAIRQARLMGRDEPILPSLVEGTVELMGASYPELSERKDFILDVVSREEGRFDTTLRQGLTVLEAEIGRAKESPAATLPGDIAFLLHDTYGFPIDLTREIVEEAGVAVDTEGFGSLMTEQRERARAARRVPGEDPAAALGAKVLEEHGATDFIGYEYLNTEAKILGIAQGATGVEVAGEGDEVDLILDRTVFYAEGGGQVGDRGSIKGPSGEARVVDTRRLVPSLTGHRVRVTSGELRIGDEVQGIVDTEWRSGSQKAHTATHILHWILRDRLGDHAKQAGSLVEPGRLRFDFSHFESLGEAGVADLSSELQTRVASDDHVRAFETSFDFAKSIGAMAIFGEKYGDFVRVVEVGEYSKELCGGTHVPHTSQIGVVVVTSEGSVGANLRRVEALVGNEGLDHLQRRVAVLEHTAELLRSNPEDVAEKVERLLATQKDMEKRIGDVERKAAESDAADLAAGAVDLDGSRLVTARRDMPVDALRSLAQSLKGRIGSGVVVLGTAAEGKANLVGALTKDLVERGLSARDLLAPGAKLLGGGGGGKPDLAISGGPQADKLDQALALVAEGVRDALRP